MKNGLPVLVVSSRPENRKMLSRVFDGLPIEGYVAHCLEQAREALSLHAFPLVFCEERLPDGSYRDLLREVGSRKAEMRFVVILCTGEWEEYLEALHLGADEVLRCPMQPTDVDLALIHVMRGLQSCKPVTPLHVPSRPLDTAHAQQRP